MTESKIEDPKWQCPICGDLRYETTKSVKVVVVNNKGEPLVTENGTPVLRWVGREHFCKGCSIMFRDPYAFNKVRIRT